MHLARFLSNSVPCCVFRGQKVITYNRYRLYQKLRLVFIEFFCGSSFSVAQEFKTQKRDCREKFYLNLKF